MRDHLKTTRTNELSPISGEDPCIVSRLYLGIGLGVGTTLGGCEIRLSRRS
jgi:hypothetical protein